MDFRHSRQCGSQSMGGGRFRSDSPRRRASLRLAAVAGCHGLVATTCWPGSPSPGDRKAAADARFRRSSHSFAIDTAPKWRSNPRVSQSAGSLMLTTVRDSVPCDTRPFMGFGAGAGLPPCQFRPGKPVISAQMPAGLPVEQCGFLETHGYIPAFRGAVPFGCCVICVENAFAATEISE